MTYLRFLCGLLATLTLTNLSRFACADDFDSVAVKPNTFLSPTRLPQSKADMPAGITIITAKEIRELGISKIPELMRLVPGMRLTQSHGWDYSVNFHGGNGLVPKRMAVLVNGVAVYHSVFQQVDWMKLPVDINDVERVEVTRSPAGAAYGSNAFQVVINIVTKHPMDVPRFSAEVEMGTGGAEKYFAQLSGLSNNTSYLLSVSQQIDDGFDYVKINERNTSFANHYDTHVVNRLNFRSESQLDAKSRLGVYIGGSASDSNSPELDSRQTDYGYTRQNEWYVQTDYGMTIDEKQSIQLRLNAADTNYNQHWPTCYPAVYLMPTLKTLYDANPALANQFFAGKIPKSTNVGESTLINNVLMQAASLGTDLMKNICGEGNNDVSERRYNAEFNDTYIVSNELRFNTGVGIQRNIAESESHLNGSADSDYTYVFSNGEYRPYKFLTVNLGFMWESVSTIENSATSPRLGFNFHLNEDHTLRLVYSTGRRMPSLLETDHVWSYYMRNWDREVYGQREGWFFMTQYSPDNLKPERIASREIGLQGVFDFVGASYDVRIFREDMSNLISEKSRYFSYNLTNSNSTTLDGFEGELKYKITTSFDIGAGYSYIDSTTTNAYEESLYSQTAGFINFIYRTEPVTYALSYYGNSELADESYNRTDITLTGKFAQIGKNISWKVSGSYYGFDQIAYQDFVSNRVISAYKNNYSLKAGVGLSF